MRYREFMKRWGAAAAAAAVLGGSMAFPASVQAGSAAADVSGEENGGQTGTAEESAESGSPSGTADESPEKADPLGTVTDGTHTIWIGESREQVIEELGEPSDGKTFGNIPIANYPGLSILYRDYGKLKASGKYPWIEASTTENGADMRVAMISFRPPEDPAAILATEYNYLTVDNLRLGAFLTPLLDDPEANVVRESDRAALSGVSNVRQKEPEDGTEDPICFVSKIWYDGGYYTEEDWKALLAESTLEDKGRKQMEMTKIWYETSDGETISRITVADEIAVLFMR